MAAQAPIDRGATTGAEERGAADAAVFRGQPRYAAPAALGAAVGELERSGRYRVLAE